eukprot:1129788-Amphidinium_carterae.2
MSYRYFDKLQHSDKRSARHAIAPLGPYLEARTCVGFRLQQHPSTPTLQNALKLAATVLLEDAPGTAPCDHCVVSDDIALECSMPREGKGKIVFDFMAQMTPRSVDACRPKSSRKGPNTTREQELHGSAKFACDQVSLRSCEDNLDKDCKRAFTRTKSPKDARMLQELDSNSLGHRLPDKKPFTPQNYPHQNRKDETGASCGDSA